MENVLPKSARLGALSLIGKGGSALVYAAIHQEYGEVAVKVANSRDAATIAGFKQEYMILRSLRHRGICRLWDFGWSADGRPFIVMELLTGGDLYGYTDHLPSVDKFASLGSFFSAVAYLHSLGIIHRDLKGDNILLDSRKRPTITDLGLASGEGGCDRGGTLIYMAPEIIDNQAATIQADIYSVGVILYRLATGELPFVATDPLKTISLKQQLDRLDFETITASYSQRLTRTIRRCLDPDPELRFKSASALAEQLALDRLLPPPSTCCHGVLDQLYHHFTSYNISFVNQRLEDLERDYLIVSHHQADASGLTATLLDHLKLSGKEIRTGDNGSLQYQSPDSSRLHSVTLRPLADRLPERGVEIDYPELDRHALEVILRKLFAGGIDEETLDLLYHYSGGNIHLLQIVLRDLECKMLMTANVSGLRLDLPQPVEYQPPLEYYKAVDHMTADVPTDFVVTLSFLAADRFGIDRMKLVTSGIVSQHSLERLATLGILRQDNYQFAGSYRREFFYHQLDRVSQKELHGQWIELITQDATIAGDDRHRQLFYHLTQVGRIPEAIDTALRLAADLRQENKPEKARPVMAAVLALPGITEDSRRYLKVLIGSAHLAKDGGDFSRALSNYAAIVRIGCRTGEKQLVAEAYKALGDLYKARCDYRRGFKVLDRAVELYRELGDELELSHCYNNIGNICWIKGDLKQAQQRYQEALEIQRPLGAKKDIASSLSNLAIISCIQNEFDEGIARFKESLAISREIGEQGQLARTANNIAVSYFWLDELKLAKSYLDQSMKINQQLGAEKELLFNYENLGEVESFLGDFTAARQAYYAGLRLTPQNDHSHRGVFTAKLAALFMKEGDYRKAGKLYEVAARHEEQVTDSLFSLELASLLGEYYLLLFAFDRAAEQLDIAMEYANKLGETKKKANLLIAKAQLLAAGGACSKEVLTAFDEAQRFLARLSVKREKLVVNLELAQYHLCSGSIKDAEETLTEASALEPFDGSELLQPRLHYLEGQLAHRRGVLSEAVAILQDAAEGALRIWDWELRWRALGELGATYLALSKYERSAKSYIEAFAVLKKLAESIPDDDLRRSYLADPDKARIAAELEKVSALTT
ncbi:MAG: tetratricopeptide repeat protein [candidate division Zixibacteria bacterium]|nr:tetratricopeptide repeat protein [candidate division Zixibacteria bacterium]